MRKKVSDVLVKLLNLKAGKNIFVRFIIKAVFWFFFIGTLIYGLLWVPKQQLSLSVDQFRISVAKVDRNCRVLAKTKVNAYVQQVIALKKKETDKAKKDAIKLPSKEEIGAAELNEYNNCVYLEGMDFLTLKPQVPAQTKNQTKEVKKK